MTIESPYYEPQKEVDEASYPYNREFEKKVAAGLSGKWPENRTGVDEVDRDAFFQKILRTMNDADQEIKDQFIEDIANMKYEDIVELFANYQTFIANRTTRKETATPTMTVVTEDEEKGDNTAIAA